METQLRAALLDWLNADPSLQNQLNRLTEEAPVRSYAPSLGIASSASADWSLKTRKGREIRIALELHLRGDDPATGGDLVSAVESRIETMPAGQASFCIVNTTFLRARAEQRPGNIRAVLLEYRFRLLEL